jgi:hypothetical protein
MASNRTTPAAPQHHLQEPVTGLYYAERPDGTPVLTPQPAKATAFHTSALAIEYATANLAGRACDLVRVSA